MFRRMFVLGFFALAFCASSVAAAQTGPASGDSSGDGAGAAKPGDADAAVATARKAREAGDYDTALATLEAAHHANPDNGLVLYERVLTLEAMGELELALEVIEAKRDVIIRHPDVNELAVVEQRLITARDAAQGTADNGSGESEGDVGNDSDGGEEAAGNSNAGGDVASGPDANSGAEAGASDQTERSTTAGWIALSAGAVAIAGGTTLMLLANSEAQELACAGLTPASDCSPEEIDRGITRAQFDDRASSVALRNTLGGVAIGLGAVALGWGIYDVFLRAEPTGSASSQAGAHKGGSFSVAPTRNGVSVGWTQPF